MSDAQSSDISERYAAFSAQGLDDIDACWSLACDLSATKTAENRRRAIEVYERLTTLRSWWGDAFNASVRAQELGDLVEAERWMARSLSVEATALGLSRMSVVLRRAGRREASLAFAKEAVARFPTDLGSRQTLLQVLDARKEYADALEVCTAMAAQFGDEVLRHDRAYVCRERARQLAQGDDVEPEAESEARALLEKACALQPDADTWLRVGLIYEAPLGDVGNAERCLRQALDLSPANRWAQQNLGRLLYTWHHRHDEAILLLSHAFEVAPADRTVAYHYANALAEDLQFVASETASFAHLRLSDAPLDGLHQLGHLYASARVYEDAADAWLAAISVDPGCYTKLHLDLAQLYLAQGRLADAASAVQAGLDRDGECVHCLRGHALVLSAEGKRDEARTTLMELVREHPADIGLREQLVNLLLEMDEPEYALAHAETAMEMGRAFHAASAPLGRALLASGRPDEARGHLQDAVEHNHELRTGAYDDLARCLDALGDTTSAEVRRRGEAFAQAMTTAAEALQGFAVATWNTAPASSAANTEASDVLHTTEEAATDEATTDVLTLVDGTLLLLEHLAPNDAERWILHHLQPTLDCALIDRLIDELFALDPDRSGRNRMPPALNLRDVASAERIAAELQVQSTLLATAGAARTAGVRGMEVAHLLCTLPLLRRAAWKLGRDVALAAGREGKALALLLGSGMKVQQSLKNKGVTHLRYANLSEWRLKRVPMILKTMPELEILDLSGNPLGDALERFPVMRNLRLLNLDRTHSKPATLASLKARLPDCEIRTLPPAKYEANFDTLLNLPGVVQCPDGQMLSRPDALPTLRGAFYMAGQATLLGVPKQPVVVSFRNDGYVGVYVRDSETRHWEDRAVEVDGLECPLPISARSSEDERKQKFRAKYQADEPWPPSNDDLVAHWEKVLGPLARPPASAETVSRFEDITGTAMPPQLASCFRSADGGGLFFCTLEVLKTWKEWKDVYDGMDIDDIAHAGHKGDQGRTLGAYTLPDWIPIIRTPRGFLAVDGLPGAKGNRGQILHFGRDEFHIRLVASDLHDLLNQVLAQREAVDTLARLSGLDANERASVVNCFVDSGIPPGNGWWAVSALSKVEHTKSFIAPLDWKASFADAVYLLQPAVDSSWLDPSPSRCPPSTYP
ncbi:MAG: SMI1/KNR4 family protein [Polyangiales bacterium]